MKVHKMYLYGSRARGDYLKHSDADVILVSDNFEHIPFLERIISVSKEWSWKIPLEVFCYTKKEFAKKEKESVYMKKILKEAIAI